ncbi:MAG TPA: PAS domain-containing protein, partial [Ilumatobacteraceae bacterium]|nr:PAS domain-containing protein [Ilumatobacteraceae bacterium]
MTTWLAAVVGIGIGVVAGAGIAVLVMRGRVAAAPDAGRDGSELALHQAQRVADRLQAALDALPVGVVVSDAAGRVVVRNRAADNSGGDTHNEVLVQAAVQHHLRGALRGGPRSQTVELFGPPRRIVVVHARPLAGEGAVATIEDITERSRLDSVRTDFVANISHELKTPIGALAVLAETMIDEHDPDLIRRLAGKTVNEAHRAAGI